MCLRVESHFDIHPLAPKASMPSKRRDCVFSTAASPHRQFTELYCESMVYRPPRALRLQNFFRVALGEPNYLLYFQRNHLTTRPLRHCRRTLSIESNYPYLPEFPYPWTLGYPQFSPSASQTTAKEWTRAATRTQPTWHGVLHDQRVREKRGKGRPAVPTEVAAEKGLCAEG